MSSNILSDGTVVPHYFQIVDSSDGGDTGQFDNFPLRIGEVIDIIYPTNARSFSKQFIEYVVSVQHRDNGGIGASVLYTRCFLSTLFGGAADKLTFSLRKAAVSSGGLSNGSKVLLLCINGETNYGVILGGMHDSVLELPESDLGHNLLFRFNGATASIDKDGQITVTFNGATKADGTPEDSVDTSKAGTYLSMLKDGTIRLVGKGVLVGGATDAWMLGTTYRDAESQSNNSIIQQLNIAAAQLAIAAQTLAAASVAMKVPVSGAVAASVPIQAASIAMGQAGSALASAATAIQSFESNADSYLSKMNKTD